MAPKILFLALVSLITATGTPIFTGLLDIWKPTSLNKELLQYEESLAVEQVRILTPFSINMLDAAIVVLEKGWSEMSPAEREAFLLIYDPANTGQIDNVYVAEVLGNYQIIRAAFDKPIDVAYEFENERCIGQRLYYIDFLGLHVCRQFLAEPNARLKARTLIHEIAHTALPALDRPYYDPSSEQYASLFPRPNRTAEIPLVGLLFREIFRNDTLFHPDAYAHYAVAVSGQPGAMELYLGHDVSEHPDMHDDLDQGREPTKLVSISWIRKH